MEHYGRYPLWAVFITLIFTLLVYLSGAYIMFKLNMITGLLFALYLILLEYFTYKEACPNCFYYGKMCFSGRGVLAGILYRKGDPQKFCERKVKLKDLIPQMLVVLIPLIAGIALLFSRGTDILIIIAMLYPIFSWSAVNPLVYGKLACPHCKQGKKCCPAMEFFRKK